MKFIFALIACICITAVKAQELQTVKLLAPESTETSDLSFLKEELKDKTVVELGEYTHMFSNIFEMKIRVIQYLHQELGFTTFAMESPMYEIWKMNQKGFTKEGFNNAIFPIWSKNDAFQKLVNYLDDNKIKVIGFDSQINASDEFIEDFFDYLEKSHITLKLDVDDMAIVIEGIQTNFIYDNSDIKYEAFEKELVRIIQQIQTLEKTEHNYYWLQFSKSLLADTHTVHFDDPTSNSSDFIDRNFSIRDKQMADNLLSYVARNPQEKIIVWADNVHLMNNTTSVKRPTAKGFVSMGEHIKKTLGNKVYSLATLQANDSVFDVYAQQWFTTPIAEGSFEQELLQVGHPYLFISSNQAAMRQPKSNRLLSFVDFDSNRLDEFHDGYIFLKTAIQAETIEKTASKATPKTVDEEDRPVIIDTPLILHQVTAKLFDKTTKQPVGFATAHLINQEIYRAANEQGEFTVVLSENDAIDSPITIEMMGYTTAKLKIRDLYQPIYLEPNSEQMEEIVINSYLSPLKVLKQAIEKKAVNYTNDPHNYTRYARVIENLDDKLTTDLELISTDYLSSYLKRYTATYRLDQIKWNKDLRKNKHATIRGFFGFRDNSVQYSHVLNKRKYKKFDLSFVASNDPAEDHLYIIAFSIAKTNTAYTARWFPTKYSGQIYIDRESFAIVKTIEVWESLLDKKTVAKRFKGIAYYKNVDQVILKEEQSMTYAKNPLDNKYYSDSAFYRSYNESTFENGTVKNDLFQSNSKFFDNRKNAVEVFEFESLKYNNTAIDRVSYDKNFWDTFYKEKTQ